jgi:threonine/homoserine/homoserine lactone efflux protein
MNEYLWVLWFALAGFCFGGVYSLYTQNKPWWSWVLVGLFGVLFVAAGVLYL